MSNWTQAEVTALIAEAKAASRESGDLYDRLSRALYAVQQYADIGPPGQ